MGSAIYLVLERELEGVDTMMNGKPLCHEIDHITALCRKLKVKDLWEFFSANPDEMADFFEAEAESWENNEEPPSADQLGPEEWFSPADGLVTVRALIELINREKQGLKEPDGVLADLRDMERILSAAKAHGVGWHLEVDF